MPTSTIVLILGLIYFSAHLLAFLFERTRIPDVLVLMILGIVIGPILKIVVPEDFGRVGEVATTIALAVILFESGTTLNISTLRSAMGRLIPLTLSTFLFSAFIIALLSTYLLGLPWGLALATGAMLAGTSSAVVIPLVRSLNLSSISGTVLIVESAITDVLCIVCGLALLDSYQDGALYFGRLGIDIAASLGLAFFIGAVGGLAWLFVLSDVRRFPSSTLTTIAFAFVLYGAAEWLGVSGAIATLAFGIAIANAPASIKGKPLTHLTQTERGFFEELVFLLKTFFFLYLGISMQFTSLWPMIVSIIAVALIYFGRIFITKFTLAKILEPKELAYASLLIPKGLAAAVLAAVPLQRHIPEGTTIQVFAYAVVFLSILTTAVLVPMIGRPETARVLQSLFGKIPKPSASEPDT